MAAPNLDRALDSLRGVLIGDSLGLVYEGLPADRGLRMYPPPLRQRLLFGWGMPSDDAAQSAMVVAALAAQPADVGAFQRDFARRLRLWFFSIPPGVGLSTVKACLRLTVGVGPSRSGVRSAGNGAAMRSAVIGAAFAHDADARVAVVEACARVTHTHPLADAGSQLVALAAALSAIGQAGKFEIESRKLCPEWPWDDPWPTRGPTGYVVSSVNAALTVWSRSSGWPDLMSRVIRLGGDTDSVGAMAGGILGASGGFDDLPADWERVLGWPRRGDFDRIRAGRGTSYGRHLAANLMGTPVIVAHGFRRLLPPF